MLITIKSFIFEDIQLEIEPSITIEALKEKISETLAFKVDVLYMRGYVLNHIEPCQTIR